MAPQQGNSQSAAANPPASGPKHGATTITDPVQMMWQQQQIQSPPRATQSPGPTLQGPQLPKGAPQLWPLPEAAAPAQRAVASPSQRRHKSQQPPQHQQQQGPQPAAPIQPGFQAFQHSLLPQLRTPATAMPLPPTSSGSSLNSPAPSQSGQPVSESVSQPVTGSWQYPPMTNFPIDSSLHQANGHMLPGFSVMQQRNPSAGGSPRLSGPFSLALPPHSPSSSARGSAWGSTDGHLPLPEEPDSDAFSTFHLPEGLAEQLSTSQQLPASHSLSPQQLPASQASGTHAQQHMHQQLQQPSQTPQLWLPPDTAQPKPKMTSPPGFARRLDGAAKPFVPGQAVSADTDRQQVQGTPDSTTWAHTPSARHMRPPPGMVMAGALAGATAYPRARAGQGYLSIQQLGAGNGKTHQHANLASGQWALTSSVNGVGPALGVPFSQPLSASDGSFSAEAHRLPSTSRWQVLDMHLPHSGLQSGQDASVCVLDSDHHETSGLAPNDVLDFLGIGSDDQYGSESAQLEQHHSQGLSSNSDTLQGSGNK